MQLGIINPNRYTHRNAATGFGQDTSLMGEESEAIRLRSINIRRPVDVCKQCAKNILVVSVMIFSKIFVRALGGALYFF